MTDNEKILLDAASNASDQLLALSYRGDTTPNMLKEISDDLDDAVCRVSAPLIVEPSKVHYLFNAKRPKSEREIETATDQIAHFHDLIQKALLDDARNGNVPDISQLTSGVAAVLGNYLAQVKNPNERRRLIKDAQRSIVECTEFNLNPKTAPMALPAIRALEGGRHD